MNFSTTTNTNTYTVIDIRKTFEGFNADLRMIANRTGKMSSNEVEMYSHDLLAWAENKYIKHIDITLIDSYNVPVKATRFTVNEQGTAIQSERAGNNDWQNVSNTNLVIIVVFTPSWHALTEYEQQKFKTEKGFKGSWNLSSINTSYNHLSNQNAQLYASNGYEIKKENFR